MKYADLHERSEDERIAIIADGIRQGLEIAVCVDDEPEKIERYRAKIRAAVPGVVITFDGRGPTPGAHTLKFRRGD